MVDSKTFADTTNGKKFTVQPYGTYRDNTLEDVRKHADRISNHVETVFNRDTPPEHSRVWLLTYSTHTEAVGRHAIIDRTDSVTHQMLELIASE